MSKEPERFSLDKFRKISLKRLDEQQREEKLKKIQLKLDLLRTGTPKTNPPKKIPRPTQAQQAAILSELERLKKLVTMT